MTAEIAILNRNGVALAADSAATIFQGNRTKVFNGVDKIFELHSAEAVGIMVYGASTLCAIPIHVIISEYKKTIKDERLGTINAHKKSFIEWLIAFSKKSDVTEDEAFYLISAEIVDEFNRVTSSRINEMINGGSRCSDRAKNEISEDVVDELRDKLNENPLLSFVDGRYKRSLVSSFGSGVELFIVTNSHIKLYNKNIKILKRLIFDHIFCEWVSSSAIGFIITGFGEKQILPSLESFEIDGFFNDRLRIIERHEVNITANGPFADAIGFAQTDLIDHFLLGVEADMYEYEKEIFAEFSSELLTEVDRYIKTLGISNLNKAFYDYVQEKSEDVIEKIKQYRIAKYKNPVIDIIASMPKQEIVKIAMSLIEITSLKRKLSMKANSVSGDVNVAFISKTDGFKWIIKKQSHSDINN